MNVSEIEYRSLVSVSALSRENYRELADLIYDTDPYIYPAMFGNRDNAACLLPILFRDGDSMFCLENVFVALCGRRIVGLLLWKKGRLKWSPELLKRLAAENGIEISPYLDDVAKEYVDMYADEDKDDIVSLINLSVAGEFRGRGIGRAILEKFFAGKHSRRYELCVLADNKNAVHLYRSLGFEPVEYYAGFSVQGSPPHAVRMRKEENEWKKTGNKEKEPEKKQVG